MPKLLTPLRAIRKNCLECCGTAKVVKYCTCDGVNSTECFLWPYRFGLRPGTARKRFGGKFLDPESMPDAQVAIEELPC